MGHHRDTTIGQCCGYCQHTGYEPHEQ
jgi:hypothetical protein